MEEFAYNNSIYSSTRYTPSFSNTRCLPCWMMLKYPKVSNNPTIQDRLEQLNEFQSKISNHFIHSQAKYKKTKNRHHLNDAPESFKLVIVYAHYVVM